MDLIALCTRRPVAVTMFTLGVLLFGMVSLSRLPVTLLPDLSYPTLTVRTGLPGAAPTEVETLLSKPIEETVGVIKNVRRVVSVSRAGQSDVTLEFNWGTVMDYAVLDVREKLDALTLPKEAVRPVVLRFDPSQDPVLRLGLALKQASSEADLKRLRRVAEDLIQKPLEALEGVAAVKISGGLEDEIEVRVDLQKLSQLNLTLEEVNRHLAAENANISGGRVVQGASRYLVRTLNQFRSLEEIRDTLIATREGRKIYLRDFAEVAAGYKEREAIIRVAGEEAVEIAVYKEGDGNTVKAVQGALARLELLKKNLPPELELHTLYNQATFIQQAISGVGNAAAVGGLLAVLVLYFFLQNAWATAVIALAIPVSVIATFNLMYGTGLTLNIMSLGGLALAIGMLVDNAIVVLESIARKQQEQGLAPLDAAQQGTREVAGAITASTLTTVAVFFPMVFVEGIAGQLFSDQALVVSGSLIISLVVSLTLIPMLAARAGRPRPPPPPATPLAGAPRSLRRGVSHVRMGLLEYLPALLLRPLVWLVRALRWALGHLLRLPVGAFQRGFGWLEARYLPLLDAALRHRGVVVAAAGALFAFSLLLISRMGVELIPPFAQGEFSAELRLAPGTPLAQTDAVLRGVQARLADDPRLGARYTVAGTGNRLDADPESGGEHVGTLSLVLAPAHLHDEAALQAELDQILGAQPGLSYRYTRPTLFTLKDPLEVEVIGYDLDALALASNRLLDAMRRSPRFAAVKTSLLPGHPEIQILFDQERAAALGLDVATLANRVVSAVQGSVATRYRFADREIDILVRGNAASRASVDDVRRLLVNPESARPVPLSAVADVRLRTGPSEIRRTGQSRVIVLSAALAEGDLGAAVAELEQLIGAQPLPVGISASVSGQSEEMDVSFRSLQLALGLAVFLVYLVMASQFESLKHPFVILFTIPLSLIGAAFALALSGVVINVVVMIGAILLAGIVVNNGIVLISSVNQRREAGLARHAALLEAGRARLRPILMTTLTTALGLLPLMLGLGEGSEVQRPMAITVIGGLTLATLLTLFVIPVVYTLLDGPEREA
ncbi:MAG: efflux RND transporter permease subunit [Gammaproteobacteria bacterium]